MHDDTQHEYIVSLDIGTSKVAVVVGKVGADGSLDFAGVGREQSSGLSRGTVVDIDATIAAIKKAVKEAELTAGCDISSVFVGISGEHVHSMNSEGIVAIKDGEVTQSDIDRVIDAAKAVAIPSDQRVLHILPQQFIIDGQEGIRQPLGMSGVRLETKVHLVTCAKNAVQNIEKCIRQCGLETAETVLQQLASSYAVLTADEKELGVCLVDIGGGTTDIAVFARGAIRHTSVIPIAGDQVTNDIATYLRTPTQAAEDLKIRYACALAGLVRSDDPIKVPSVGEREPRKLSRHLLAEVVEARYDEIFKLALRELQRFGVENSLAAGVVLTGGTSKIQGAVELAEEVFNAPVRIGMPEGASSLADIVQNPIYSTGVGLLLYGLEHNRDHRGARAKQAAPPRLLDRIRAWLQGSITHNSP